jgi:hypothetical protein
MSVWNTDGTQIFRCCLCFLNSNLSSVSGILLTWAVMLLHAILGFLRKICMRGSIFPCTELKSFKYKYLKLLLVSTDVQNATASQNNTLKVNKLVFVLLLMHSKRDLRQQFQSYWRLFSKLAKCNGALHALPFGKLLKAIKYFWWWSVTLLITLHAEFANFMQRRSCQQYTAGRT